VVVVRSRPSQVPDVITGKEPASRKSARRSYRVTVFPDRTTPVEATICENKDLGYSFFPSLALPNNAVMLWRNFANNVCNSK